MADRFDMTGKVALVTGASGGLGRHFASVLALAGAEVVLAARRQDALAEAADRIEAAGGRARTVGLDVTDARSVDQAFQEAGPVDVLINNSGVTATVTAVEMEEADWDRIVDTNLKGAWLVARAFARQAIAAKHEGAIVNIASILGLRVAGHLSAYAASKAGLIQLTQTMALELARHQIRVNALAPGYIETDINRDFFQSERGKALIARIPQRRLGQEEDLDGPLLLLASDASRFMTGSVVAVDGGHLVSSL
ncbi:MAG TPA: glucose 1-dehydrogenase [Geminicoccus sp.]|uniref:SDR family NAD(P)-dependent oxidoreductase n=1 Tax=Geminicoccus sp. TaxID=2024832 RepID=UPI002D117618|nr:glucose 1-dehydrogenase [Geminicoccus sp.]HWL68709.1 glucose 1-dehydrogenase [Geminicoccus sp.]